MGMRSLYFDVIPENALENIIRFFSRWPRVKNWPNHTRLEDVYGLYEVEGELGRFLLARFTGVHVATTRDATDLNNLSDANEEIISCTEYFLTQISTSGRVVPSFGTLVVGGQ